MLSEVRSFLPLEPSFTLSYNSAPKLTERRPTWNSPQMLPGNPNLLGLNVGGGQKILLRLRPHHAQDTFLELDDVVGTMLHEVRPLSTSLSSVNDVSNLAH